MRQFNVSMVLMIFFTVCCAMVMNNLFSAQPDAVGVVVPADYDSDSEDEAGYVYHGLGHLTIPEGMGERCLAVMRGVHFSPASLSKQQRSHMRKTSQAGQTIFSSAAYDVAHKPLGSIDADGSVQAAATSTREKIKGLPEAKRHVFQELYSNNYDGFHNRLSKPDPQGIFSQFTSQKNPQVSTSEYCFHAVRYAMGVKYLGSGVEPLKPEYNSQGKPKHPYLGKLYVMLVDEAVLEELSPYFVVWAHANMLIKVSDHFRKNVLVEREVSFPGYIPGRCVVLSVPVRVPSFEGEYKQWYFNKYGLTKLVYNNKKKMITSGKSSKKIKGDTRTEEEVRTHAVSDLLEKYIVPHVNDKLMEHVRQECAEHHKTLVYKKLGDGFGATLVPLANVSSLRQAIAKGDKRAIEELEPAS